MKRDNLANVIRAMLNDNEFRYGGIFSKEEYYMKKYNISEHDMIIIQARLYWALHPSEEVGLRNVN